ncbi:hypothetical protein E4T44_03219 [Aureobasidium sp. EXF-8845]|nr:hypothetical protein E4T44_03219 [Aureobasidium sp. EXF-8845]KAI4855613.1 hypothetical protein E4T45_02943 [Aureobasidium sp. EXF-8846]
MIASGTRTNSYVLGSTEKKRSHVETPESREWVSTIEVVSPHGGFIRPLVIFMGLSWSKLIFEPETKPQDGERRLLIMDGHGSHTAIDFLWHCKQNKIHILSLPAHPSNALQHLDLGVFATLESI